MSTIHPFRSQRGEAIPPWGAANSGRYANTSPGGLPAEAVAGDSPVAAVVPFWITACVRLMPPRRRTGAEVTASLANAVFPAVQALIADQEQTESEVDAPLDRDRIARRCGLGDAKKAGWLFDHLTLIVDLERAIEAASQGLLRALFVDEGVDHHMGAGTFVYVIGSREVCLVKIGVTRDVIGRLKQLQNSSPSALELLWCAQGSHGLEQQLHAHFQSYRVHGEWFDFGPRVDPAARIKLVALRFGAVEVAV